MRKLRSLQVLRAFAASAVVLTHAAPETFRSGGAGVDLFFVISGFIIATVAASRTPGEFLFDRAWRIYPPMVLASIATVVVVGMPATECRTLATTTLWPIWDGSFCKPYVWGGWSLCFEMLFYVGAALAVWRRSIELVLVAFTGLLIAAFVIPSAQTVFMGSPLAFEFMAGALITRLPQRSLLAVACVGAGLLLYAVPFQYGDPLASLTSAPIALSRALHWGIPAALLVYAAASLESAFRSGLFNPLVRLGDASYSLYLTHMVTLSALANGSLPINILIVICVGIVSHLIVERPLLRLRPYVLRYWHSRQNQVFGLEAASVSADPAWNPHSK